MTNFFEVTKRDSSARIGSLKLSTEVKTPLLIDSLKIGKPDYFVCDGGSLWLSSNSYDSALTEIESFKGENFDNGYENNNLYILPRITYTLQHPEISYSKYEEKIKEIYERSKIIGNFPTCAVIRPKENKNENEKENENDEKCEVDKNYKKTEKHKIRSNDIGADVYIFESVASFENDPIKFYDEFQKARASIPFDSALWLPNFATPENVAMLIYLGADIFDTIRAVVSAGFDKYMTNSGIYELKDLKTLPCSCKSCNSKTIEDVLNMESEERLEFLINHNVSALNSEIELATQKLQDGNLREYVEGQCRVQPWLAGLLRLYDADPKMDSVTPAYRNTELVATTGDSLNRSEIKIFAEKIKKYYKAPEKDIIVIFPCSAKKPYSISNSHRNFIWAMGKNRSYVNEIIITSPLGLIPRELELTYPAAHYDTTVTGHWDLEEKSFVGSLLKDYLEKHKYKYVIAHVSGSYKEICEEVSSSLGIEFEYTSDTSPASRESCNNLKNTLERIVKENTDSDNKCSLKKRSFNDFKKDQCTAILRHQFGEISEPLYSDNFNIKANFPKYQLYSGKVQTGTLVPQYGLFSLTISGVEKIINGSNYNGQNTVFINKFVPKGSLLAPGILDADLNIRPGDEVFVSGDLVIGVGKAFMSGEEMKDSTKGVSVLLRHTKEIEKEDQYE